jgi:hypothetical protein
VNDAEWRQLLVEAQHVSFRLTTVVRSAQIHD